MDEEDISLLPPLSSMQEVILVEKKDKFFKLKHKRLLVCNICLFTVTLIFLIYVYFV